MAHREPASEDVETELEAESEAATPRRPSLAQLTTRALLDQHTPPAVTIDRELRIVFFNGRTEPYLAQPRGEPTRELMTMVREGLRGAVRHALRRAMADNVPVAQSDGWIEDANGRRARVNVRVSPLDPRNAADHFVVSFQDAGGQRVEPEGAEPPNVGVVLSFIDVTRHEHAEARDHEDGGAVRDEQLERLEQLRLMVEGTRDFAMITLDAAGAVTSWSTGADRLLGYESAELLGRELSTIFTEDDRAIGALATELGKAERFGRSEYERWHQRKDGTRFWANGVVTASRYPSGRLRGYVVVLRDETARKRAEEEMQASKEAAERANKLKDDFLAMLSHELRTPLASILIWSKLLAGKAVNAEQQQEGLNAITRSAEAQKQLIEDLLEMSRITSTNLRLDRRATDLVALVTTSVDTIVPTAEAKQIAVQVRIAPDVGMVIADPDRLRQVLMNLLANAVKFTPHGGHITVSLLRRGRDVEMTVADDGIGIEKAFLPEVFEPFRQGDAATTRKHGGLGLGLAIAKQLVEAHDGTIGVESEGDGGGTTFTVKLPLPELRAAKPSDSRELPAVKDAMSIEGVALLVVEDDVETRTALLAMLAIAGAKVAGATSALEALELLRAERYDVLISDVAMPSMDGYELIRRVRAGEGGDAAMRIPTIALSAFARSVDRDAAIAAGFDVHIAKPIMPESLIATIAAVAD